MDQILATTSASDDVHSGGTFADLDQVCTERDLFQITIAFFLWGCLI